MHRTRRTPTECRTPGTTPLSGSIFPQESTQRFSYLYIFPATAAIIAIFGLFQFFSAETDTASHTRRITYHERMVFDVICDHGSGADKSILAYIDVAEYERASAYRSALANSPFGRAYIPGLTAPRVLIVYEAGRGAYETIVFYPHTPVDERLVHDLDTVAYHDLPVHKNSVAYHAVLSYNGIMHYLGKIPYNGTFSQPCLSVHYGGLRYLSVFYGSYIRFFRAHSIFLLNPSYISTLGRQPNNFLARL